MQNNLSPEAVLFDLDGTLVDTAPDLVGALFGLMEEAGLPTPSFTSMRNRVSHGASALIKSGFNIEEAHPEFGKHRQALLDAYEARVAEETQLFDGISEILSELIELGIAWGIVTNKPTYLTEALLDELKLPHTPACIICGDTYENRKPHPEPLLKAADLLNINHQKCIFVGDANIDILAGEKAGMLTLLATYGYIEEGANYQDWGANGYLSHPTELRGWVNGQKNRTGL